MKTCRSYVPLLTLLVTVMLMVFRGEVKGQCTPPLRVYADAESHGNSSALLASSSVDNPTAAVGANLSSTATELNVTTLLGAAEAWTELKFTNATNPLLPLPAGTTTYVKIGGASAGALLGLIGGSNLPVFAYTGATTTGDGTPISSNNVNVTNLTTVDGTIYLAITPSVPYNAVRIALNASVLIGTGKLLVYHAFYQGAGASCDPSLGASTTVSGLLTLGGNITNPNSAIDNNLSTYASFSMGVAGVGTTLKETVYFPGPSRSGDAATITFSIPPALLLDLSLLNNVSMTPYNGSTAGTPVSLSSLLSLDLLSLLRANNAVTVSLVPPTTFDRIEISMGSLLSLLAQMNLYEVQRTPPKPTFTLPSTQTVTICSGQSATLTATAGSCNELHWYTVPSGGTGTTAPSYNTGILTNTTTYYVASAKIGCSAESERVPIIVNVNPLPIATISGTTSICQNETAPLITFIGSGGTAPYTFTYNINGGASQTVSTITGNSVTISTPTGTAGSFAYNLISVKDNSSTQCSSSITGQVATITINPLPTVSAIIGNTNICVGVGYTFINTSPDPGVWSSDNPSIATVDATGFVKGISVGIANIKYTITNATTNCSNSTSLAVNVSPLPTISLGNIPAICEGITTTTLPYTAVSSGSLKYDIIWNTTSLTNLSGVDLPASPIQLNIPSNAPAGTYTGTFSIRNSTSNCTNSYPINLTINQLPSITLGAEPTACKGTTNASLAYSSPIGTPISYNIVWTGPAITAGFLNITNATLPSTPIVLAVPTTVSVTTYGGTISVKNANGCIGPPIPFNITIHTKPLAPTVSIQ